MSHNPTYRSYPYTENTAKIENEIAEYVHHACWQEGGSLTPIRWMNSMVFNSLEEARQWLEDTDNGWYDNRAVVYKDYQNVKTPKRTKKYEDLMRRLKENQEKLRKATTEGHYDNVKSALISCRNCGSKIAKAYLKGKNFCPVCRESMLPPTKVNQIKRYEEIIEDIKKQITEENIAYNKKLENVKVSKKDLKWLVYYDYHT